MKHLVKQFGSGVAVFAMLGIWAESAYADGYRNPPPTAEGIGRSGANMIFVDDASAVFYNPANLAMQEESSIVVDATLARVKNKFKSDSSGTKTAKSDADWQLLPNVFFSMPAGDTGVVLGMGIGTPYGQGIDYNKKDLVNMPAFSGAFGEPEPPAIYSAEVGLINFNPTIAFKVHERVAIGVGADIYYSKLEFKQYYPWGEIAPIFESGNVKADGDGFGYGGNAAVTWNMTDRQRMAFSYRSEVKVKYEGDFKINTVGPPNPATGEPAFSSKRSDFDMDIKYPTTLGLGYGIQVTDAINVEANLEWLGWSVNKTLEADLGSNGSMKVPQKWDDTITFSIGSDWQFSEHFTFRTGYAYIETPIPEKTVAPSLPDADRHVLSVGLGWTAGGHTLDVAYSFSFYDDLNVDNNQVDSFNGDYDIDSNLVGLTYSYTF
ncbi:OmpP1/FadL family transporter [Pontiella sulfatireligans]|uniref:Outer membrane protein n=1 Tax=Pontiella sulfatireligans TaxID=2750658 RepID=A0A6C2UU37_9BACT|nr:outer membrane protein transport protein [Pontiella sulfatireligans]VGO22396.1 Putative outer membrane protein [Pontiella sulfatireligans]